MDKYVFGCCAKLFEWQAESFSSIKKWPGEGSDLERECFLFKEHYVMTVEHIIDDGYPLFQIKLN